MEQFVNLAAEDFMERFSKVKKKEVFDTTPETTPIRDWTPVETDGFKCKLCRCDSCKHECLYECPFADTLDLSGDCEKDFDHKVVSTCKYYEKYYEEE